MVALSCLAPAMAQDAAPHLKPDPVRAMAQHPDQPPAQNLTHPATNPVHGPVQDLADVWQRALQRDPAYAAIQAARQADQEVVPQARAQLLPYLAASAGVEIDNTRRRRDLSDSHTRQRGIWALTLTQPVVDLGAWNALQRAQYMAASADVQQAHGLQNLMLRVAQAYFDVLAAQDTLRALQAQKHAIEAQLEAAQHHFELGSTSVTDMHEAQARLDLVQAAEYEAINALQVSRDILASIIYEQPGDLAELPPGTKLPAPQPDRLDDWVEQGDQANLAVLRAELETRIIEKQLDMARSERYPRLALQAQTGSASDRGIYGTRPDPGPRSLDSTVGLVLSIPLYTGGEISSVVREQTSRLQQVRYEFEAARRNARQATQQHFSGVTSGLARVSALEAAVRSSQAAMEANELAYEVGVRINIDVLNAQQQLYETQRQLSHARYHTLMESLRLKAGSGILTEADLLAVNDLLTASPQNPPATP